MKAICQAKELNSVPPKINIFQINFEFHEPVIGHYIFFNGKYFKINDIIYQVSKQPNGDYAIPIITISCSEATTAPMTVEEFDQMEQLAII